jgi:hypothetical protein
MSAHLSHIPIFILLLSIILVYRKKLISDYDIKTFRKKFIITSVLSLIAFIPNSAPQAKSKHVFFMGRMAENGILISYLKEACPEKHYKLCDCIDLIPNNTTDFLWNNNSPVYKQFKRWRYAKEEYSTIIFQTFLRPKYLIRHIFESVKSTCRQLIIFNAGDGNGPYNYESGVYKAIVKYFPHEINDYIRSKQNNGLLTGPSLFVSNIIFRIIIAISVILIMVILLYKQKNDPKTNSLLLVLFIGILLNSFINASLVMVTDRFGARVIWFIPLALLILIGNLTPVMKHNNKGPYNTFS